MPGEQQQSLRPIEAHTLPQAEKVMKMHEASEAELQKAKATGGRRSKLRKGIAIDAGAANNVMHRRMVRRKETIRTSPSSLKAVH